MRVNCDAREVALPVAPEGGEVTTVKLAPDGATLAFVCVGGAAPGIYAGKLGGRYQRIVECRGVTPVDLTFAPSGLHVAYRIPRSSKQPEQIGWAPVGVEGQSQAEAGRIEGVAFGWYASGKALMVCDAQAEQLLRVKMHNGVVEPVTHLHTDVDPWIRPQLSASPDASRFVFTTRSVRDDLCRVSVIERSGDEDGATTLRPVTAVPGADVHVFPFWSPRGNTLGLHFVHLGQQKSGIVLFRQLSGDGEVVYQNLAVDAPVAPAWSPSGGALALYRAAEAGVFDLVLLSLEDGRVDVLATGQAPAELHFVAGDQLALDGVVPGPRVLDLSARLPLRASAQFPSTPPPR